MLNQNKMTVVTADTVSFIYERIGKYKVLTLEEAISQKEELFKHGWKHIDTVEDKTFLKSIIEKHGNIIYNKTK